MQWPINEWNSFINKERQGIESTITKIEMIDNSCTIISLDNDDPILLPCWEGTPKDLSSLPLVNDKIIVERNGTAVPIVYNKTANAYLLSDYSDQIITLEGEIIGNIIDFIGLRKQIAIQNEPNFLKKIAMQTSNWVENLLFGKIKTILNLPKMLSLTFKWLEVQRSRGKNGIDVDIYGTLKHFNTFTFKTIHSNSTTYHSYIFARIFSNELNNNVSVIYSKLGHKPLKVKIVPQINSTVQIIGKVSLKEGTLFADDIIYGGKTIFSKGIFGF